MPDTKPPAPLPRVRGVSPLIWRRLLIPFEDLVVWLVTRSDKSTVAAFARVAWRTVGAMCERVAAEKLDPTRLAGLVLNDVRYEDGGVVRGDDVLVA
jgi:hypothetical protein